MTSTILFLSGQSMGDALGAIGRSYRSMFEGLGYEFIEVQFGTPESISRLDSALKEKPVEFVFSFMGMCADFVGTTADGRQMNLWEGRRIPFISLYGDSPAYFFDRHLPPARSFACLYAFPEHVALRKRLTKSPALIGVAPPHVLHATAKREMDFRAKANGKIYFLKNGNSPSQLLATWREALSADIFLMLADLAAELAGSIHTDVGCDIDRFVCTYFHDKGLEIETFTSLRLFFIAQLDDYLRRIKSTFIAETLLDFPIEIHGYNWEHVNFSGRRARHVPGGNYSDSTELIRNALGLLDMSPNTTMAPHERPLRAFGMSTLCLTNNQQFFQKNFAGSDAFSFNFEKESLQSKVADVLAHPQRYVELGIQVADAFNKSFDAAAFSRLMLDTASCIRLGTGPRPDALQNFFVWPPTKGS